MPYDQAPAGAVRPAATAAPAGMPPPPPNPPAGAGRGRWQWAAYPGRPPRWYWFEEPGPVDGGALDRSRRALAAFVALVLFGLALVLWNVATHGAVYDKLPLDGHAGADAGAVPARPAAN